VGCLKVVSQNKPYLCKNHIFKVETVIECFKMLFQIAVLQLSLTKYSMAKWCKDLMNFET